MAVRATNPFLRLFSARKLEVATQGSQLDRCSEPPTVYNSEEWTRLLSESPKARTRAAKLQSLRLLNLVELDKLARWVSAHAPNLHSLSLDHAEDASLDLRNVWLNRLTSLVITALHNGPPGAYSVPRFLQITPGLVHLELDWSSIYRKIAAPDVMYEAIADLSLLRVLVFRAPFDSAPLPARFIDALARLESVSLDLYPLPKVPAVEALGWCSAAGLFRRDRVYSHLTNLTLVLSTVPDAEATREALGGAWPRKMFPRLQMFKIDCGSLKGTVSDAGTAAMYAASKKVGFKKTEHTPLCLAARRK